MPDCRFRFFICHDDIAATMLIFHYAMPIRFIIDNMATPTHYFRLLLSLLIITDVIIYAAFR